MRAIVHSEYGPPDVLRSDDVPTPVPQASEVLIRVRSASINPADWHFMRGLPYLIRLGTGLTKPKPRFTAVGIDVAGVVEQVGPRVTAFAIGDEVFGAARGSCAEFTCAPLSGLARKPGNVSFENAASTPIAAITALQALRDKGGIRSGDSVLINGAAGGVGTFAVQIAKTFGAQVVGVCSARNVELLRSIGADRVIDYTHDDFTTADGRYDLIVDCIGNRSFTAYKRVLTARGTVVAVGGPTGAWMIGSIAHGLLLTTLSRFTDRKMVTILARVRSDDLTFIGELLSRGAIRPVIDSRHSLAETANAMRHLEAGHARGKVVINVGED